MTSQSNKSDFSIRHVKHASVTNDNHKSLVKVIIQSDEGKWVRPAAGERFYIDESATFPLITFEISSDAPPPYQWKWTMSWDAHVKGIREKSKRGRKLKTFTHSGSFTSNNKTWVANLDEKVIGGKLCVEVETSLEKFTRTVFVSGKNPTREAILSFLSTIPNISNFEKIINQESHFKHFSNSDGEPLVSGDRGYGLVQMTNPEPSYEQTWNWKENIKAGTKLFKAYKSAAKHYLKHYTEDQLLRETISRWNGGTYYETNPKTKKIERKNILCDPSQSNIGWKTDNPLNSGKTSQELHSRDKEKYHGMQKSQSPDHPWTYTGVCYAEHILDH
jgi:hypothetical protein